jgi:hypothetical protein
VSANQTEFLGNPIQNGDLGRLFSRGGHAMIDTATNVGLGTDQPPVYSTLLALVQSLQDENRSEEEVVETALELVNSGRVVLTGNFKGCRLEH